MPEARPITPINLALRLAIMALFGPAILLIAGGDWRWTMGWILAVFLAVYAFAGRWLVWKKHPSLIAERRDALKKDNVEPGDKALVLILGVILPTLAIILAGFDHRNGWSAGFPQLLSFAAFGLIIAGILIAQAAIMANPYFSATIRIQEDRGQTVVSTGPYRIIRHPGYAGGILVNLCLPLALSSWWACLPGIAIAALTVLRTAREDRALQLKLSGYAEYAARTKYRLIPGIW